MTKQDLNKFIDVCGNLPNSLKVMPMQNNFVKVMDLHSKISLDGKRGVAVDLFVLDNEDDGYSFINGHTQRKIHLKNTDIFPLKEHLFEKSLFPIPRMSKKILSSIYGDFMKLPPVEQRFYSHTNDESIKIYEYPSTV